MNKHLLNYLYSFKSLNTKKFLYTFILDSLFIFILFYLLFNPFFNILSEKSTALSNGQSVEMLKQDLASLDPEKLTNFTNDLKAFVYIFIGGFIFLTLATLFLYSFSRFLIWNLLFNKPFYLKNFKKWILMALTLLIVILLYCLFYIIVNLILSLLVSFLITDPEIFSLFNQFIQFLSLLFFFILTSLIYSNFTFELKIFDSVRNAFRLIKLRWSRIWRMFLLALFTVMLSYGILYKLISLFNFGTKVGEFLGMLMFLLILAWLRVYLIQTVGQDSLINPKTE